MELPTYTGEPLAVIMPLTILDNTYPPYWVWVPRWGGYHGGAAGWYQVENNPPVILAFEIEQPEQMIPMLSPFPLPQIGEYGIVDKGDGENVVCYRIKSLPAKSRQRWETIGELLRQLSEPLLWSQHRDIHAIAFNSIEYQQTINHLETRRMLLPYGDLRFHALAEIALHESAQLQLRQLREMLKRETCKAQWEEVQRMTNQLAQDYYEYHEKKRRGYVPPLPEMTSGQHTAFPSNNHIRGVAQSFGPHVARSLWNTEDSREQQLKTPNGSLLVARGENEHEQKALHSFIEGGMGVEGLKYMATLLSAYNAQTGATNRKDDARVTLRQLLMYMGRGDHADDLDEQRKLMHYILYLSRTWVTALEKEETRTRRGRPPSQYREYTPLIVLEGLKSDVRGGIRIPDEVEFHLGKEFWDQMFGDHKHFFTLPTALILGYHSVRQQQEICLAFYLANMLNLNQGKYAVHFPRLLIETGMQGQDTIDQDAHRTRDALRVIYALEQLEKDSLLIREPHIDIDTVLAVEMYSKAGKKEAFSDATLARVHNAYRHFQALSAAELRSRRRTAIKHLLDTVKDNSIVFKSGLLINGQIEKRIQGTQLAIGRREQAQKAARSPRKRGSK